MDDVETQAPSGAVKKQRLDPVHALQNGVQPSPTTPTKKIVVKHTGDAQQQEVLHTSSVHEYIACVNLLRQHIQTYRNSVATQVFVEDLPEKVRAFVSL